MEEFDAICQHSGCRETEGLIESDPEEGPLCPAHWDEMVNRGRCSSCGGAGYRDRPNSSNPYVLHYTEECSTCGGSGESW